MAQNAGKALHFRFGFPAHLSAALAMAASIRAITRVVPAQAVKWCNVFH
jgi:hypothetical protein